MGKRMRRSNPAEDVFRRRCERALASQKFHDEIRIAREQLGISPRKFPERHNAPETAWWELARADWFKCVEVANFLQNKWFQGLPEEYHAPLGSATTFVRWALCYDIPTIPIPPQRFAQSPVTSVRQVVEGPLGTLIVAVSISLADIGLSKKDRIAFLDLMWRRWFGLASDRGLNLPLVLIGPLMTSEQYRNLWPAVERARDSAYGRQVLPRRTRNDAHVPRIASLWGEGKRVSKILEQIADEVSYDQARAVIRRNPRGSRKRR
jgi:hypothetical protein